MLKRDMARELDGLRHQVSQLRADKERLESQLAVKQSVVIPIGRAALLARAKELSMATGVTHRVNDDRIEAFDAVSRAWF